MSDAEKFAVALGEVSSLLGGQVELVDHPVHGFVCVALRAGRYDGAVVAFGEIRFVEAEDGELVIKYDYEMVEEPSKLDDKTDFENYVGELLTYLMLASRMDVGELEGTGWDTYALT